MDTDFPQRILYIDCAPFTGGAQRSLHTMLEGVRGRGLEPVVLSADHSAGGLFEACAASGIPARKLRTRHWSRSVAGALEFAADRVVAGRAVARAVREWHPAILHANGVRSALLVPRAVWRQVPMVVHDRDLRIPALAVRLLAKRARAVIAISCCVAAKWPGRDGDARVHVVPNGFDWGRFRATVPAPDLNSPRDAPVAVLVADLVPWKQHGLFLDAIGLLRAEGIEVRSVVVGRSRSREGERYLSRLRATAQQLRLADSVRFVTDASSALPWIAAADMLVSAAVEEPFGRTIVEALALGKPVVAVSGGGPAEILDGCPAGTLTGLTATDLAAGIRRWLDPACRAAARELAIGWAARYGVDIMVDAVCALYRDLLPSRPRSEREGRRGPRED